MEDEDDWMGDEGVEGPVVPKSSGKNMSKFTQSVTTEVSNKDYLHMHWTLFIYFARGLPG